MTQELEQRVKKLEGKYNALWDQINRIDEEARSAARTFSPELIPAFMELVEEAKSLYDDGNYEKALESIIRAAYRLGQYSSSI